MVNVIFDSRKWKIQVTLKNEDCPFLFYPANIYACKLLHIKGDYQQCNLEDCPIRKAR